MTSSLTENMAAWFAARPLLLPFFWIAACVPGFPLCRGSICGSPPCCWWLRVGVVPPGKRPRFRRFSDRRRSGNEQGFLAYPNELFRSSIVVLIMMFAFGIFLAGCDIFWKLLLSWGLGILSRVGVRWTI